MRKLLGILAAAAAGIGVMATPIAAFAEYPDRPITIVVPYGRAAPLTCPRV